MTIVGISVLSTYQAIRNKKIPSSNCLIIKVKPMISCPLLQPAADTFLWNIVQKMWESARLLACIPLPDLLTPTSLFTVRSWEIGTLMLHCIVRYWEPFHSDLNIAIPYFSIIKLSWNPHFAIYYWPLDKKENWILVKYIFLSLSSYYMIGTELAKVAAASVCPTSAKKLETTYNFATYY